tara:strand:+ start:165 stop:695 length:531 start_codon:yes stop_codon:yes gene_type:complete
MILKMKPRYILLITSVLVFVFNILTVTAHCPLCTIGAVAAAGGAAYFGVSISAIGVFLGGFGVSMGWWIGNHIKKKFIPYQKPILILVSFLTTVIPLIPLLKEYHGVYVPFFGEYGSTISIEVFSIGAVVGGIIVCITPFLSKKITDLRKNQLPFQGIVLTFILLLLTSIIFHIVL